MQLGFRRCPKAICPWTSHRKWTYALILWVQCERPYELWYRCRKMETGAPSSNWHCQIWICVTQRFFNPSVTENVHFSALCKDNFIIYYRKVDVFEIDFLSGIWPYFVGKKSNNPLSSKLIGLPLRRTGRHRLFISDRWDSSAIKNEFIKPF